MALLDTFSGSVAVGCLGSFMIYAGKIATRKGAEFYRELFNRDPIRTTSFDLLLAFLQRPTLNPVVFGITIWLGGWFFALLGFLSAFARFHEY